MERRRQERSESRFDSISEEIKALNNGARLEGRGGRRRHSAARSRSRRRCRHPGMLPCDCFSLSFLVIASSHRSLSPPASHGPVRPSCVCVRVPSTRHACAHVRMHVHRRDIRAYSRALGGQSAAMHPVRAQVLARSTGAPCQGLRGPEARQGVARHVEVTVSWQIQPSAGRESEWRRFILQALSRGGDVTGPTHALRSIRAERVLESPCATSGCYIQMEIPTPPER